MNTKNAKLALTFHKVADLRPKNGQSVLFVRDDTFHSYWSVEQGVVEYIWEGLGDDLGTSYLYDPKEPQPENTELVISVEGAVLSPTTLWADMDTFFSDLEDLQEVS